MPMVYTNVIFGQFNYEGKKQRQSANGEGEKHEHVNALKEVKRLCKEFGFTAGMLKGSLAEGRQKK
jgi:hypothetical protein